MLKNFKYLMLSLSVVALFSCTTYNKEVEILEEEPEDIEIIGNGNVKGESYIIYTEGVGPSEIKHFEIKNEKNSTLKNSLQKSINASTPVYQQNKTNTKKVEKKIVLIKPVNDYSKAFHDLSEGEIKSFMDYLAQSDSEALDEGKNYESQGTKVIMENYKNLLSISSMCCSSNLTEELKNKDYDSYEINDILKKDKDYLLAQDRCILVSEEDIEQSFDDSNVIKAILKSKENCICNNKPFIRKNINNFYRVYNSDSEFYRKPLIYRYKNKNGDIIEEDVNETVLNIALTLEACP